MHILITGATGFIGSALVKQLKQHKLTILTRSPANARQHFASLHLKQCNYLRDFSTLAMLDPVDAIINLAGEPIIDKAWTEDQKQNICHSRWDITQQLVNVFSKNAHPLKVFISGSAVGYYGDHGDQQIDETFTVDKEGDFPHQVCSKWEKIALAAQSYTRVCILRTGIVLGNEGGAFPKMAKPYKFGLGGRLASGEHYIPWIHIHDMVQAILYLLNDESASGPYNLCAPQPQKQIIFSKQLAHALRRPHITFTPRCLLNFILGERSGLILDSIRAHPRKLLESGFQFTYPDLPHAYRQLLSEH